MTKFIFLLIAFFSLQNISAQDAVYQAPSLGAALPYETVEVKPQYDGGYIAFVKYIAANFVLPEVESLSGAVKVTFVIDTNGKIDNIKVIQDLGEGTGEEAVRVLKTCPNWTPGEQEGKKVKVLMNMPINLKI
jgi:periplasmic protein TonB